MENKIPTAEEWVKNLYRNCYSIDETYTIEDLAHSFRSFAKLHIQAQVEAIKKNIKMDVFPYNQEQWEHVDKVLQLQDLVDDMEDGEISINIESIDNAYPLENVK